MPFYVSTLINPLLQPTQDMAAILVPRGAIGLMEIYIFDLKDFNRKRYAQALVAGSMASSAPDTPDPTYQRWEMSGVAATSGYGPLIYDLTAWVVKSTLYASNDQSRAALGFWEKQGARQIDPLTDEAFLQKYGTTPETLFNRSPLIPAHVLAVWQDELVEVFYGASDAERKGRPLRLPREARPNSSEWKWKTRSLGHSLQCVGRQGAWQIEVSSVLADKIFQPEIAHKLAGGISPTKRSPVYTVYTVTLWKLTSSGKQEIAHDEFAPHWWFVTEEPESMEKMHRKAEQWADQKVSPMQQLAIALR